MGGTPLFSPTVKLIGSFEIPPRTSHKAQKQPLMVEEFKTCSGTLKKDELHVHSPQPPCGANKGISNLLSEKLTKKALCDPNKEGNGTFYCIKPQ